MSSTDAMPVVSGGTVVGSASGAVVAGGAVEGAVELAAGLAVVVSVSALSSPPPHDPATSEVVASANNHRGE
jgi:hypothetical protein